MKILNGIPHARLARFVLMYLIYARVFILAFIPVIGLIAWLKLPDRYYEYWALCFAAGFFLPSFIVIALAFAPKCPFCAKSVCVTPFRGRHPDFPENKRFWNFWEVWFFEIIRHLRTDTLPCHHCGREVHLGGTKPLQSTQVSVRR